MQAIFDYVDANPLNFYDTIWNKYDIYQKLVTPHLRCELFPWIIVILTLNSQNLRKPIILILFAHFFIRYLGDLFYQTQYILPTDKAKYSWPSSMTIWYVSYGVGNIFFSLGEIIGDWYPLLRTKAVANNGKKVKFVYATCILYNLSKILGMFCYFYDIDLTYLDGGLINPKTAIFKIRWWSIIALIQVTSCIYDISVIYALKACLFNRLKEFKNSGRHNFLEKFQRISEFRIVVSMAISLIFLPFVFFFVYVNMNSCQKSPEKCDFSIDFSLENIRRVVICLNYNFMFIDQILLRRYAERSNQRLKTISSKSINYNNKSKSMQNDSYNHEYNEINKYNMNLPNSTSYNSQPYSSHTSSKGLLFSETIMNNKNGDDSYSNPFVQTNNFGTNISNNNDDDVNIDVNNNYKDSSYYMNSLISDLKSNTNNYNKYENSNNYNKNSMSYY
ncbi:hypothetical protein H8356DRAFT_1403539 [Neocallimastix lanati (nom. inval.)]|jgi:hypothetical protein|uniref:Uncharacterized protein n=1 Tax=Neocallimastix californiae TaxID=1754190 RepID=A0A1Y2CFE1_9FUNG|nr:hypothetical protein H8356DRAFT_1403539 [Neocallimastix sp. JGI-2020a]ORY45015.1 hypothetical protein LY90DRAFT_671580 [Neocallimastix californiae]|eukprot:ORY45015.1 hypothetical protein LY90DRAFT_671580 [Neocallimastix californiae]